MLWEMSMCMWERDSVCVRMRKSDREIVCERERERVCVCVWACVVTPCRKRGAKARTEGEKSN